MKKPIEYMGKIYPTKISLARELGLSESALLSRIKSGWPQEKWGLPLGANLSQIEHLGVVYPAKAALAVELGISVHSLEKRIQAGWEEEDWGLPVGSRVAPSGAPVTYEERVFPSRKALAEHLGISPPVLSSRLNRGWPQEHWGKPLGFRLPSKVKRSKDEKRRIERQRNLEAIANKFPDIKTAAEALLEFMKEHRLEKVPTAIEVRSKRGGSSLIKGIQLNGGLAAIAAEAGLELEEHRKRLEKTIKDWDFFCEKLLKWIDDFGEPGVMPTSAMLRNSKGFGNALLSVAGSEFGGMKAVAEKLGLKYTYKTSNKDWEDIAVVKAEVLSWNKRHRRPLNILPTASDLGGCKEDRALSRGIRRHGYFPDVAELLGMEFYGRKRRCGISRKRHQGPITYRGRVFASVQLLAEHLGINSGTLRDRIDRGWPEADWTRAVSKPPQQVGLGYCLADMPQKVQQIAISLADSLGIEPAQAYALVVEEIA